MEMDIKYLAHMKNLEVSLKNRTDVHQLLSSSIKEPTLMIEKHLSDFCKAGIEEFKGHLNAWNYPPLIEELAKRYEVDRESVITTNGASNAIYLISRALVSSGDHVIVEWPAYAPLYASAKLLGAEVEFVRREPPDYSLNLKDLEDAMRPNTKAVILSNLHNPSGALLTDESLRQMAQILKKVNPLISIVVDEIYHELVPGRQTPAARIDECFVTIGSLTKTFGLGSIHSGWIIARPELISRVRQIQVIVEGSGSKLLDAITSMIVRDLDEYLARAITLAAKNRELLSRKLKPLLEEGHISGKIPDYGCICFLRVGEVRDTSEFVSRLADEFGVYVVPGHFFGDPSCIRIGFGGDSEALENSLKCLETGVKSILCS